MKKQYQGVVFDLDGTLLNTLGDLMDAVNITLREYGLPERSTNQIRGAIGNGVRTLIELSIGEGRNHPHFEEMFDKYIKRYSDNADVKTCPYDGILDVLKECRTKGIKTGIISNKVEKITRHLSEQFFGELIDVTIGDNGIRERKPAPDSGYAILDEMGLDKESVLYVGDSPIDAKFSSAVGMDCLLVSYGFNDEDVLKDCDSIGIVKTPKEIQKYL